MQNETGLACETNFGERGCGDRDFRGYGNRQREDFRGYGNRQRGDFHGYGDREETFHQISEL